MLNTYSETSATVLDSLQGRVLSELPAPLEAAAGGYRAESSAETANEGWREFDPLTPPPPPAPQPKEHQAEIADLFDDTKVEGEEVKYGRRFIHWLTIRDLNENHTADFMVKLAAKVHTAFYVGGR